jgi:hypothetical protein
MAACEVIPPRASDGHAAVDGLGADAIDGNAARGATAFAPPRSGLGRADEVLLVGGPFDLVRLRDLLAQRGFASWAEARSPRDW